MGRFEEALAPKTILQVAHHSRTEHLQGGQNEACFIYAYRPLSGYSFPRLNSIDVWCFINVIFICLAGRFSGAKNIKGCVDICDMCDQPAEARVFQLFLSRAATRTSGAHAFGFLAEGLFEGPAHTAQSSCTTNEQDAGSTRFSIRKGRAGDMEMWSEG